MRFVPLGERSTRVGLHHTGWGDGGECDKACNNSDQAPLDWTPWRARLRRMR